MNKVKIIFSENLQKIQNNTFYIVFKSKENKDFFNIINNKLNNELLEKEKRIGFEEKNLTSYFYKNISVTFLPKKFIKNDFQDEIASIVRRIIQEKYLTIGVLLENEVLDKEKNHFDLGKLIAESIFLPQHNFNKYKSEESKKKHKDIVELNVIAKKINTEEFIKGFEFGEILSSGVIMARELVNEPSSFINPETLAQAAFDLANKSNNFIKVEILDRDECKNLGMGAYLSVAQGSDKDPKFIILKTNISLTAEKIVLIGKSVTFDSGGISLKPSNALETMKSDMAGGATVLGVFKALFELNKKDILLNKEIIGILPACENMPSGKAIKPGDIVSSLNGKSIEILNTDAEGRLTLADALAYSDKYLSPKYIIDLATLTGAIIVGLGADIAGLLGNNSEFNQKIIEAAREENEAIWEMPLYEKYTKRIKSDIAEIRNTAKGSGGGAITGALFLKEFISDKINWAHIDIGPAYNEGEAHGLENRGGTGWGVRTIINLIYKKI